MQGFRVAVVEVTALPSRSGLELKLLGNRIPLLDHFRAYQAALIFAGWLDMIDVCGAAVVRREDGLLIASNVDDGSDPRPKGELRMEYRPVVQSRLTPVSAKSRGENEPAQHSPVVLEKEAGLICADREAPVLSKVR